MLDQIELDVVQVIGFDYIVQLLEEVPLGHLIFDFSDDDPDAADFSFQAVFLKFEESFKDLSLFKALKMQKD